MSEQFLPPPAVSALGLTQLEAQVLGLVLTDQEVTIAQLMRASGLSNSVVCKAVAKLERTGLLDRVPGRKPTVLFLHVQASAALGVLVERTRAVEREVHAALEALGEQVRQGVARAEERRRPYFERDPRPRGLTELPRPSRRGRTHHDEVVAMSSLRAGQGARSGAQCPARVLVAGRAGPVDLVSVARVQVRGSEVRATSDALPELCVLDGERVGLRASTREGWQLVWSNDAVHVRAAAELFALWWERAEPVRP